MFNREEHRVTRAIARNSKWRRRGREEWQAVLARFAASGLGIEPFCVREGLSESSFRRWRSLLGTQAPPAARPESGQAPEPTGFVDAETSALGPRSSPRPAGRRRCRGPSRTRRRTPSARRAPPAGRWPSSPWRPRHPGSWRLRPPISAWSEANKRSLHPLYALSATPAARHSKPKNHARYHTDKAHPRATPRLPPHARSPPSHV